MQALLTRMKDGGGMGSGGGSERNPTIIRTSRAFVVPPEVTSIDVFCVGGGSGGNPYSTSYSRGTASGGGGYTRITCTGGNGGQGGETVTLKNLSVTPGQIISCEIGVGGKGGYGYYDTKNEHYTNEAATKGGDTKFGTYIIAHGGTPNSSDPYGSGGGQAGGQRECNPDSARDNWYGWSGDGGTDGSNGYASDNNKGGSSHSSFSSYKGQGRTTRAFEEADQPLFSAGGAGGGNYREYDYAYVTSDHVDGFGNGGFGGSAPGLNAETGGGGAGGGQNNGMHGGNATPGTGSGGGGGRAMQADLYAEKPSWEVVGGNGGNGADGLIIVRW